MLKQIIPHYFKIKTKLKYYFIEFLLFLLIITLLSNLLSFYKSNNLNKQALMFEKLMLIENSLYKIDFTKPFLIHFWATWCPTCKLEAQNIEYLSKHYNVISIAVNSGSDQDVKQYMDAHNLSFKVLNDQDSIYAKRFHISAYPTTFIYNSKQELVFSEVGYTSTLGLYLRMWWASL